MSNFPAQDSTGTCGLYALKYCLHHLLQENISIGELQRLTGLSNLRIKMDGVGEDVLCKVARKFDLQAKIINFKNWNAAKFTIKLYNITEDQHGCAITAWHAWLRPHFHWITVTEMLPTVTVLDSVSLLKDEEIWEVSEDEPCQGTMELQDFLKQCKPPLLNYSGYSNIVIDIRR